MALTIVTLLSTFWAILEIIPNIHYSRHHYSFHEYDEDNVTETATPWPAYHEVIGATIIYGCINVLVDIISIFRLERWI